MRRKRPSLGVLVLGRDSPAQLLSQAARIETLGFDRLWVADERFFRDCWVLLGTVAARLPRLGVGVCVTDPYVRHPGLTAAAAATVDEVSEGGFILGLGAGISGFEAMGIERNRPLTAMREAIGLIRALLAGERVSTTGEVVSFHEASLDLPPRPNIPIMIATNGPRMLQLAGEMADIVTVQGMASQTMVKAARHHITTGAERVGRNPDEIRLHTRLDLCISDAHPNTARAAMRPGLVRHLATHHPRYASFGLAGIQVPAELATRVATVGYGHRTEDLTEAIPEEWIDTFCLAGTTAQIRDRVGALVDGGVDGVTVMPIATEDVTADASLEQFAGSMESPA